MPRPTARPAPPLPSTRGLARRTAALLLAAATATGPASAARAQDVFAAPARTAIAALDPGPTRATLDTLYGLAGGTAGPGSGAPRLVWTDARGRPTRQARAALDAIAAIDAHGLDPAAYDAPALRARLDALLASPSPAADAAARFDVDLSVALVRMLSHLHSGRVDPRLLGLDLPAPRPGPGLAGLARTAAAGDPEAAVRAAEPPHAAYRALVGALAHYRALAAGPDLRPPAPPATLHPGAVYPDAPVLRRYLAATGDAPPAAGRPPEPADTLYDDGLEQAVMAFQLRHGLEPDGIVGPATVRALREPPGSRARQIALTMERWRWLPDTLPARSVIVNVPAFRLHAFEGGGEPIIEMDVIVGAAEGGHDTPLFVGTMREVVFQPYWDVPPSIARTELLPRARRDPGYLRREHLEIVRGGDHDAVTYPATAGNLRRVAAGSLRLRQRPGPWNALGAVKFVFPNRYNVYMHGTPAQELFARARRDFSHGCIRLSDPTRLAVWALDRQPGWEAGAVEAAMTTGSLSRRVQLARPIAVHVLYATVTTGADGRARFHPDLYDHDRSLARALEQMPR